MAAMTTVLTEFSDSGNSRTYTTANHTTAKPCLVIQKRKVPSGSQTVQEVSFSVVHATEDTNGAILPSKVVFEAIHRSPIDGDAADVTAAKAIFLDIVAGDEFANTVTTQEWLS